MTACMLAYTFYESDNRVRRYAEALVRRGDEVDAIVLRRENQPAFEVINGVRVHRIQKRVRNERNPIVYLLKLLLFLVKSAWAVTLCHLRRRYDIIHVHSVPDFEVFATLIPRLTGARVILDIHDIVPEFYASKFKVKESSIVFRLLVLAERMSVSYADHVIIANHIWHTKLTQRSVRPEKCTAIINYPDPAIFSVHGIQRKQHSEFVMCYPGTLNWHQGVDRAVSAVALLKDQAPDLRLLIIGDGPDREKLREMVRKEKLENYVTIAGSIPIEEVARTMASVDLGVVPKRSDSFGNEAFSTKIMEFMAMGVPVIASRTRVDQYYFNENIVEFFDSNSVDDLAARILTLRNSTSRRNELRERSSQFIRVNNWDVKSHEYFQVLDRLLNRQAPALCA